MNALKSAVCVIIPFYQNTAEPLIRAIQSILDQQGVDRPQVLIVDDGSPLPAQPIIDENFPNHEEFIRVIVQKNSGAAKARNTGLDNVPEYATFIAFLDSDDEWTPHHLSNAVHMLNQDYDFYFADHKRCEWNEGKFAMVGLSLEQNKLFADSNELYEYTGEILRPVMHDHLIQTSSVVYSKQAMNDIRFPVDLVLGEDEIFWVKAMRRANKIGFCSHIEVLMGKGVNISQGGDWGNTRSFELMEQNLRYWQSIPDLLPEEAELKSLKKLRIHQLRRNLAASVLHNLRCGLVLPMRPIFCFTRSDPLWLLSIFSVLYYHFFPQHKDLT